MPTPLLSLLGPSLLSPTGENAPAATLLAAHTHVAIILADTSIARCVEALLATDALTAAINAAASSIGSPSPARLLAVLLTPHGTAPASVSDVLERCTSIHSIPEAHAATALRLVTHAGGLGIAALLLPQVLLWSTARGGFLVSTDLWPTMRRGELTAASFAAGGWPRDVFRAVCWDAAAPADAGPVPAHYARLAPRSLLVAGLYPGDAVVVRRLPQSAAGGNGGGPAPTGHGGLTSLCAYINAPLDVPEDDGEDTWEAWERRYAWNDVDVAAAVGGDAHTVVPTVGRSGGGGDSTERLIGATAVAAGSAITSPATELASGGTAPAPTGIPSSSTSGFFHAVGGDITHEEGDVILLPRVVMGDLGLVEGQCVALQRLDEVPTATRVRIEVIAPEAAAGPASVAATRGSGYAAAAAGSYTQPSSLPRASNGLPAGLDSTPGRGALAATTSSVLRSAVEAAALEYFGVSSSAARLKTERFTAALSGVRIGPEEEEGGAFSGPEEDGGGASDDHSHGDGVAGRKAAAAAGAGGSGSDGGEEDGADDIASYGINGGAAQGKLDNALRQRSTTPPPPPDELDEQAALAEKRRAARIAKLAGVAAAGSGGGGRGGAGGGSAKPLTLAAAAAAAASSSRRPLGATTATTTTATTTARRASDTPFGSSSTSPRANSDVVPSSSVGAPAAVSAREHAWIARHVTLAQCRNIPLVTGQTLEVEAGGWQPFSQHLSGGGGGERVAPLLSGTSAAGGGSHRRMELAALPGADGPAGAAITSEDLGGADTATSTSAPPPLGLLRFRVTSTQPRFSACVVGPTTALEVHYRIGQL